MIRFAVMFPHVLIVLLVEDIVAVASPVVAEEAVAAVAGKPLVIKKCIMNNLYSKLFIMHFSLYKLFFQKSCCM